jgi:hypothetical protein
MEFAPLASLRQPADHDERERAGVENDLSNVETTRVAFRERTYARDRNE